MKTSLLFSLSLWLSFGSCGQENRNVKFFEETEAYELALFVEKEKLIEIEKLVKGNPKLLSVTNASTGSNVLDLSLTLENFEAFEKLLQLGADPNFINPYSRRSILIEACKFYWKPEPYTIDLRYIELLLQFGANPNYMVEDDFTDKKGHYHMATSPLIEASKLDLKMVKMLIKAGADPYRKLKKNQETPFTSSLRGFKNKFKIASYFIDSLEVEVTQPLSVIDNDSLYIQDYVVNSFLKARLMDNIEEMRKLKKENPNIEEANRENWAFVQKLEKTGVDFKNHNYDR
jgi:hypothetical protein